MKKSLLALTLSVAMMFGVGNAFATDQCNTPPCVIGDYQIEINIDVANDPYHKTDTANNGEDIAGGYGQTSHTVNLFVRGDSPDTWAESDGYSQTKTAAQASQDEIYSSAAGTKGEMSTAKAKTTGFAGVSAEGVGVDCEELIWIPIKTWFGTIHVPKMDSSGYDNADLRLGVYGSLGAYTDVYSDDKQSDSGAWNSGIINFAAYDTDSDTGSWSLYGDTGDNTAKVDDSMFAEGEIRSESKAFAVQGDDFVHVAAQTEIKGDAFTLKTPNTLTGDLNAEGQVYGNAFMPQQGNAGFSGTFSFSGAPLGTRLIATGQSTIDNSSNGAFTNVSVGFQAD